MWMCLCLLFGGCACLTTQNKLRSVLAGTRNGALAIGLLCADLGLVPADLGLRPGRGGPPGRAAADLAGGEARDRSLRF